MRGRNAYLLAAGVSVFAVAIGAPAPAAAQTIEGERQEDSGTIAINLYKLDEGDPAADFGSTDSVSSPGGGASANAQVVCAESATCTYPGAIEQVANGTERASNLIAIGGLQVVRAEADASGRTAMATASVDHAVSQTATSGGLAENQIEVSGVLDLHAAGTAIASAGTALAQVGMGTGILQVASGDGVGTADIANAGLIEISVGADAISTQASGLSTALLQRGIVQSATGGVQGAAGFDNSGGVSIDAHAQATGQVAIASAAAFEGIDQQAAATAGAIASATAAMTNSGDIAIEASAGARGVGGSSSAADAVAFISRAAQQFALGRGTEGGAGNVRLDNGGTFSISAAAAADASDAAAVAIVGTGLSQVAFGFDSAAASINNSGTLSVGAQAAANGEVQAIATAVVQGGIRQSASVFRPGSSSSVTLENSGSLIFDAEADAFASQDIAMAIGALGTAIYQAAGADLLAEAALVNSGLVQISGRADAVARDSAVAVAAVAGVVRQSASAFGEEASASADLTNSATITVGVDAVADGGALASAVASVAAGVSQLAYTGRTGGAEIAFANSGSLSLAADAAALGIDVASATARIRSGIVQFASAATAASASFQNGGELTMRANAAATAVGGAATGNANVYASAGGINQDMSARLGDYALTTTADGGMLENYVLSPSGPASASLSNSGIIRIVAEGTALSQNSPASALVIADGLGQIARGTDAAADFANEGDFIVAALAEANGLDAAANAQVNGISQMADAVQLTQTALYVASTPVSLATGAMPTGTAAVSLTNLGAINVTAMADATGRSALAGLGVAGIGQDAAGAEAAAILDNSGSITISGLAGADAQSNGEAIAAVNGIVQIAESIATRTETEVLPDGTNIASVQTPFGPAEVSLVNTGEVTIGASAAVSATGTAFASAVATAISQMAAGGDVSAVIDNSGSLEIAAIAGADGDVAAAYATAAGFGQIASAVAAETFQFYPRSTGTVTGTITVNSHQYSSTFGGAGPSSIAFTNSGLYELTASAVAEGEDAGYAGVNLYGGLQDADGNDVDVTFDNSGEINWAASAAATADTFAAASAYNNGFVQYVNATEQYQSVEIALPDDRIARINAQIPVGPAAGSIVNDGTIDITAVAQAGVSDGAETGTTFAPGTAAFGTAYASGLAQYVWGTAAVGTVQNSGALSVAAQAQASGEDTAGVRALAQAVRQGVNTLGSTMAAYYTTGGMFTGQDYNLYYAGPATASLDNSGSIQAIAGASAIATDGRASAAADARGLALAAAGTEALVAFDNSGDFTIAAVAEASGTTGLASAVAAGMTENFTTGTQLLAITVTNSGSISIGASAEAIQDNGATALAAGIGIIERGTGYEHAQLSLDNSGQIDVTAIAAAEGGYFAGGTAFATGVSQRGGSLDAEFTFTNSGDLAVAAGMSAIADAGTGFAGATAHAHGYTAASTDLDVQVSNDGAIDVAAVATAAGASGWAWATAAGVAVAAIGGTTSAPATGILSGAIANGGSIKVAAQADGIADSVDALASTAEAVGILLVAGGVNASVSNSGLIDVTAIVSGDDGLADAAGVRVTDNGQPAAGNPGWLFTFTNEGGTIISRESIDGGTSWRRGMAIDVAQSPNASVINLFDGAIYGNIDIQSGDEINVESGTTVFDGIINPEFLPPSGVSAASLDTALSGEGTLNIANGGNLVLVSGNPNAALDEGPSYAFVDTLNIDSSGTLTLQLPVVSGGTQPVGSYPQVFADTANLGGTLVANVTTGNGLFADSYFWNNVIDANMRSGTFDQCVLAGPYADSALLDFDCAYDGAANVDLGLERVAFNALGGLTNNQLAVATGLENAYDIDLTGDFGDLVAELFTLDDAELVDAYDQLSGFEYPQYLHAIRNNSFVINSFVSDQMDCAVHLRGMEECSAPQTRGRIWAMGMYNGAKLDSSAALIGYDSTNWSGHVGGDYQFGSAKIGAFAGYRSIKVDFPDASVGSKISGSGWQAGAYGAYDVGSFYGRAIVSYSSLSGDSERNIAIGSIAAKALGEPDVTVWSIYGEAGGRFQMGSSWLTPYVALDHTAMRLKAFTETGGLGANLAIESRTASQTSGLVGVKWAGNWNGIVPEAKIAYRYDFDRDVAADLRFAGGAGSDFVKEESYKRGSVVAGLGIAGALASNVTGRIGYQGRFNSQVTDHAINGALTIVFGAPAAALPAIAETPAPPPPTTQTCPDGTMVPAGEACPASPAPPPPPLPAPERG